MKKVKIVVRKWKSEEVEYICKVDDRDWEENSEYGIAEISSLGDMSNSGGDASGMNCTIISERVIEDSEDLENDIIKWEES